MVKLQSPVERAHFLPLGGIGATADFAGTAATGLAPDELLQAGAHATIADFTDPALWSCLDRLEAPRHMTFA